jgi:hypothetical protein
MLKALLIENGLSWWTDARMRRSSWSSLPGFSAKPANWPISPDPAFAIGPNPEKGDKLKKRLMQLGQEKPRYGYRGLRFYYAERVRS